MDISKLTPAPWEWVDKGDYHILRGQNGKTVLDDGSAAGEYNREINHDSDDAEFISLARNAFDVMMRRGWHSRLDRYERWIVFDSDGKWPCEYEFMEFKKWTDPFTALVEADRWYREHVESKP